MQYITKIARAPSVVHSGDHPVRISAGRGSINSSVFLFSEAFQVQHSLLVCMDLRSDALLINNGLA
jgi:hypothetical protein